MTDSTAPDKRSMWLRRGVVAGALVVCAVVAPAAPALAAGSAGSSGSADGSSVLPMPIPSPAGLAALAAATTQTGKPYVWGGTGPHGWDCSGLVQWAFRQAGVQLPRVSQQQAWVGAAIPEWAMAPGDIITFRAANDHVGIYAGFGQVFNANSPGIPIGLTPLSDLPPINQIRRF